MPNNEKDQLRRKGEIEKLFKVNIIDFDKLKELGWYGIANGKILSIW